MLERARAATERYWDVNTATSEGFVELPGCESSPAGAVGVEYTDLGRSSDQEVDVEQPESLWYMPEGFGGAERLGAGRRLVAVEYHVPVFDDTQEPPELFGRRFNGPASKHLRGLRE